MRSHISRYTHLAALGFALAAVPACKGRAGKRTAPRARSFRRYRHVGRHGRPIPRPSASAAGKLTDANIVALLDEANMADSAAGAYAVGKATSPDVKAFAKLMMGEHHSLRAQGQKLAKQLPASRPRPPADDPLKPAAESEMAALKAAPKGGEFYYIYIEQEIAGPQARARRGGEGGGPGPERGPRRS